MQYRVTTNIRHQGKDYVKGDLWNVEASEEEMAYLLSENALEPIESAKPKSKPAQSTSSKKKPKEEDDTDEKKNDEIPARANKAELLKIAADEEVPEVDETKTNEEIRLAITKHRAEKQNTQG